MVGEEYKELKDIVNEDKKQAFLADLDRFFTPEEERQIATERKKI